MPRAQIRHGRYAIDAVQPEHIEAIRQWRNAQMDVLRQTHPITPEQQVAYFAREIWPDLDRDTPRNVLVSLSEDGVPIGYAGLVHIAWPHKRAEVSFLLNPEPPRSIEDTERLFGITLGMLRELAFRDLGLQRLTTETYDIRDWVLRTLERVGFQREGRLRGHVRIDGRPVDAIVHGLVAGSGEASTGAIPHVLVTSASRKVPLIRAVTDAARRLHPQATVTAADGNPLAPSQHAADAFWVMPPTQDEHLDAILEGCRHRGITAILPTRDGELAFWARARDRFLASGIDVWVSPLETVDRCLDKLAFATWAAEQNCPVIPASPTLDALGPGPYVVKERYGAGSRSLGLGLDAAAAHEHAKHLEHPIFQPFVRGPEISVDAWLDRAHRLCGLVLRRRDLVAGGESQVTTTFRDPAVEAQLGAFLEAMQICGHVVLQAIVDGDGAVHIIECNARFGGASTASIAVGLDTFGWSLRQTHDPTFCPVFERAPHEVQQVRSPSDRIRVLTEAP